MQTVLLFCFFFIAGYQFFLIFSHPQKRKHTLPRIKYKNIEILPNVRIHFRSKTYWFHHWLILSLIAGFITFTEGFLALLVVKAVMMGGIAQGLRYHDRFCFRLPRRKS
ncbi:MAG TPA: hypothetical protein VMR41_04905 [Patescibacteria group bacterium]|nr:hypothetical protein [Patescibacteria group bacterium]